MKSPDDEKSKEEELLRALTERGELTPTAAAMRTSLTIEEASKMLDELAGKGHLKVQTEDGIMALPGSGTGLPHLERWRPLPSQYRRTAQIWLGSKCP